ncbi:MAG: ATP-binding protein [Acetatifactor sp.]|nr:ATP-binding protein [Acetatifactor sp.]
MSMTLLSFGAEICIYMWLNSLLFDDACKRPRLFLLGVGIIVVTSILNFDVGTVILELMVSLLFAFAQGEGIKTGAAKGAVVCFLSSCLHAGGMVFLELFADIRQRGAMVENLAEQVIILTMILPCFVLTKRIKGKQKYAVLQTLSKTILPFGAVAGLVILFAIAGLRAAARTLAYNHRFYLLSLIVAALSYLALVFLSLLVMHIRNTDLELSRNLQAEEQRNILQREYYELLLKKEEDTKRFRHEMNNYLVCMSVAAEEENLELLRGYISDIGGHLNPMQRSICQTGNWTIDALTNHYVAQLGSGHRVCVRGAFGGNFKEPALSIVYGNLLRNAVEELVWCDQNASLDILFEDGRDYARITIANSTRHKITPKKGEHYGFGMRNIRDAVHELNGSVEYRQEDHSFTAIIVLPKN